MPNQLQTKMLCKQFDAVQSAAFQAEFPNVAAAA
jgi:hypothetical protein